MASDQSGDDSAAACDAVGDTTAVESLEFTGIPAGDNECFVWLVLRTEYESMGLQVLEHEPDEDDEFGRAWTDPPIKMQDGLEYVYLYPDNIMDLLRAPRGEPVRLQITKLVTGNKEADNARVPGRTREDHSIAAAATADGERTAGS